MCTNTISYEDCIDEELHLTDTDSDGCNRCGIDTSEQQVIRGPLGPRTESEKYDGSPPRPIKRKVVWTMSWVMNGRQLSMDEWNLAYATNGTTLRAACEGEGLAVSGTNAQRARRLSEAGLTRADVEKRYGWQARRRKARPEHPEE